VDVTFNCETCGQELVIDEAGAGALVDCPHCESPLLVPGPPEEVVKIPVDLPSSKPLPKENICPFCAEPIKRKAILCDHCGRDLVARRVTEAAAMRGQGQSVEPTGSPTPRTIVGVVAVLLVVGVPVLFWPRPTTQGSPSVGASNLTTAIATPLTSPPSSATSKPSQPPKATQRIYNVEFAINAPNALSVNLAGAFNNWSPTAAPMHKRPNGKWAISLQLPAGRYPYKFVVDGMWVPDPENPNQADNYSGGKDSVVVIG
jgi:DNA-directed RNA polymerase subunit RPC12/RpoP